MRNYEDNVMGIGAKLISYGCSLQANSFDEYASDVPQPASDFINGSGRITNVNLCVKCFADMSDETSRDR